MTFTTSTLDAFFAARERHVRQYLLTVRTDCPEVLPPVLKPSPAVPVRPSHLPRSRRVFTDAQLVEMVAYRAQGVAIKALALRYHTSIEFVAAVVGRGSHAA